MIRKHDDTLNDQSNIHINYPPLFHSSKYPLSELKSVVIGMRFCKPKKSKLLLVNISDNCWFFFGSLI